MILDIVDIIEWITNIPGNLKIILGGLYNPLVLIVKIIAVLVISVLLSKIWKQDDKKSHGKAKII